MPYIGQAPAPKVITSSDLSADVVTEAKIADNAVENEHLNANVITGFSALGAEPADTDEFLISDAGTLKRMDYSYIKGGGSHTLLSTSTISSGTASVTFNNSIITSTYRDYLVTCSDLTTSGTSVLPVMTISDDNGSSFKSVNYRYGVYGFESAGGNISHYSGNSDGFFKIGLNTDSSTEEGHSFRLYINNPLSTSTNFSYFGHGHTVSAGSNDRSTSYHTSGYFNGSGTPAFNCIKFSNNGGQNFDTAVFKIYGIT